MTAVRAMDVRSFSFSLCFLHCWIFVSERVSSSMLLSQWIHIKRISTILAVLMYQHENCLINMFGGEIEIVYLKQCFFSYRNQSQVRRKGIIKKNSTNVLFSIGNVAKCTWT